MKILTRESWAGWLQPNPWVNSYPLRLSDGWEIKWIQFDGFAWWLAFSTWWASFSTLVLAIYPNREDIGWFSRGSSSELPQVNYFNLVWKIKYRICWIYYILKKKGSVTLCITYISKATTAKERTTFIAINALVSTIGFIVGPGYITAFVKLSSTSIEFLTVSDYRLWFIHSKSRPVGTHSAGDVEFTLEHVHGGWMADRIHDSRSSHFILPLYFPRIQHGRKGS